MTYSFIRLDDDQLERLADLIAERLRASREPGTSVDAKELADFLGVSRGTL